MTNNRLAMFSGFTHDIPVLERLTLIRQAGFGATMLDYNDDNCTTKVDEQVAHCNNIGLQVCCAHLRFNDGNAIWNSDQWADQLIHDIASCRRNGISIVVMHPTQGDVYPDVNSDGIARIERIANFCLDNGVTLAIENKRNSDHIERIFQNINNKALAYCYDIGHEAIYLDRGQVIDTYNGYYPLAILHMHDNHHTADEHMIPMDGAIDYPAVIAQLRDINYQGHILLECRKEFARMYDNMTNQQFVAHAYDRAQYLYSQIIGDQ